MLEKILNAEGTERLSEKELKSINGGNYPPGICGYLPNGKPIKCQMNKKVTEKYYEKSFSAAKEINGFKEQ